MWALEAVGKTENRLKTAKQKAKVGLRLLASDSFAGGLNGNGNDRGYAQGKRWPHQEEWIRGITGRAGQLGSASRT